MKQRRTRSVCAAVLVVAATALGASAAEPHVDSHSELTVSAAASLTAAFQAAAAVFEKAHPGVEVKSNFAGRPMAEAFVAFVLGADGRAILEKLGFLAP